MKYILILLLLSSTAAFSQKLNFIQLLQGEKYSDVKGKVEVIDGQIFISTPKRLQIFHATLESDMVEHWYTKPLFPKIQSMKVVNYNIGIPGGGEAIFHYENNELRSVHISYGDRYGKDIIYFKYKQ